MVSGAVNPCAKIRTHRERPLVEQVLLAIFQDRYRSRCGNGRAYRRTFPGLPKSHTSLLALRKDDRHLRFNRGTLSCQFRPDCCKVCACVQEVVDECAFLLIARRAGRDLSKLCQSDHTKSFRRVGRHHAKQIVQSPIRCANSARR